MVDVLEEVPYLIELGIGKQAQETLAHPIEIPQQVEAHHGGDDEQAQECDQPLYPTPQTQGRVERRFSEGLQPRQDQAGEAVPLPFDAQFPGTFAHPGLGASQRLAQFRQLLHQRLQLAQDRGHDQSEEEAQDHEGRYGK